MNFLRHNKKRGDQRVMNILVAGGGLVGETLTQLLAAGEYNVTLIDTDTAMLEDLKSRYDLMTLQGNCASMDTLLEAGVKEADLLIAATNADEVNLLCCTTAHGLNQKLHTIARIRNPEYTDQLARRLSDGPCMMPTYISTSDYSKSNAFHVILPFFFLCPYYTAATRKIQ